MKFGDIKLYNRRRGTAIVVTDEGILVVGGRRNLYMLPGGAANKHESRRKAAIRELQEETGLKVLESTYLFSYKGGPHRDCKGRGHFRDCHKVFLIKAEGAPKPQKEVKRVAFFNKDSNLRLSHSTREMIEMFLAIKGTGFAALKCLNCGAPLNPNDYPLKCPFCGYYYQKIPTHQKDSNK